MSRHIHHLGGDDSDRAFIRSIKLLSWMIEEQPFCGNDAVMSLPASWFHWDGNGQEVICWQFVTALWIECGGDSSVNISSHWHHWSRCCPPEQLLWAILEGMKNENTSSVAQVCSWLRDTTRRQTPSTYFSAEPTSQKPKRPSVSDCKCYIRPCKLE